MATRSVEEEVELSERCLKAFERLVRLDEQDERTFGIRAVRPYRTAERLGVERYLRAYCQVTEEDYEPWYDRITRMYAMMHYYDVTIPTRNVRQDIVDNCLYQEYLDQLDSPQAITTFAAYATFISAKAIIMLITERTTAVSVGFGIDREAALRFKARDDYDETNPVWFLSHVFLDVPGTWEAAQVLQQMYGDVVRVECGLKQEDINGILPDDPQGEVVRTRYDYPEEVRIEQAIQAFLADEGPADEVATRYGIGQKRFRQILKNQGLMRSHGGDRKGKRKAQ